VALAPNQWTNHSESVSCEKTARSTSECSNVLQTLDLEAFASKSTAIIRWRRSGYDGEHIRGSVVSARLIRVCAVCCVQEDTGLCSISWSPLRSICFARFQRLRVEVVNKLAVAAVPRSVGHDQPQLSHVAPWDSTNCRRFITSVLPSGKAAVVVRGERCRNLDRFVPFAKNDDFRWPTTWADLESELMRSVGLRSLKLKLRLCQVTLCFFLVRAWWQ